MVRSENPIAPIEEIAKLIVQSGTVEVRNVDGGDEPFVYSTGNRGPGYVMIKGLVGQPTILKFLIMELARKIDDKGIHFDFIEGNATGGMVPGWELCNQLSQIQGRDYPYCYLRSSRKEGGHGELITGDKNNPLISLGDRVLVFEELVNYAGTTTNAAKIYRGAGYEVTHAATIFHYDNPEANKRLEEMELELFYVITLPQLLDVCEKKGLFPQEAIQSYRDFLASPIEWQLKRNLVIPELSVEAAEELGYKMETCGSMDDDIEAGAPPGKVKEGVRYWKKYGRRE
jgi:orotate phosphoribosyltransferase